MKIRNLLTITAAAFVVLTAYVVGKAEQLLEETPLGYLFDGVMIAALFYGVMSLLKWFAFVLTI